MNLAKGKILMSEHFIRNINIKKFKCFEHFEAQGFARVNLITGKNNVGKTAFMEALYINSHSQNLETITDVLRSIKGRRENINILAGTEKPNTKKYLEQTDGVEVDSNINNSSFNIINNEGVKQYHFKFNHQEVLVNVNDFYFEEEYVDNIEFIDNFGLSNEEILNNFTAVQRLDKEVSLNETLNQFDDNIENFKKLDEPECKINGQYLPITELGDGVRHLVSVVTSLFKCQDGYLFIDEMDNGIHYSKLDELWAVILKTAKALNVQIFATTHSKECIESYVRAAKKLTDEEVALIELGKKDDKLASIVLDYNEIISEVENAMEVRGW
jgi:AAA15 family ATPase/GTPase